MRRGQVTVFIVLGLVILGTFTALHFLRQPLSTNELPTADVSATKILVSACLTSVLQDGAVEIAKNGGYAQPQNEQGIPTYLAGSQNQSPGMEHLERALGAYIVAELPGCITFEKLPVSFTRDMITTTVNVQQENIHAQVNLPLQVGGDSSIVSIETFEQSIVSRLGNSYQTSQDVLDYTLLYDALCMDCIAETAQQYDNAINIIRLDTQRMLFTIEDQDVMYRFAWQRGTS